jgi:hypothetical protein
MVIIADAGMMLHPSLFTPSVSRYNYLIIRALGPTVT